MRVEMHTPHAYEGWVVMTKSPDEVQVGSIYMPTRNAKQAIGAVVSSGSTDGDGLMVGDVVVYQPRGAIKVTLSGVDYVMVKVEDVCASVGRASVDDQVATPG